jgi:hypothetical protein
VIPATSTAHDALRLAGVSTFLDVVDGVEQALDALRREAPDDEVPSPDSAWSPRWRPAQETEREGFEPSMELVTPYSLSRRVPSATRPPLPGLVAV